MTNISGVITKKRKGIDHWQPLLEKWIQLINDYCRIMNGNDSPWLYTERSLTGLLGTAAWNSGSLSLEEFQYQKGLKNKPKWNGRVDLYIADANDLNKEEELVEAKYRWLCLSSNNNVDRSKVTMDAALKDVRNTLGGNEGILGIAVGYFPFYLKASLNYDVRDVNNLIEKRIAELRKESNHDAIAWIFPNKYRMLKYDYDNTYSPGVVLLAKNYT